MDSTQQQQLCARQRPRTLAVTTLLCLASMILRLEGFAAPLRRTPSPYLTRLDLRQHQRSDDTSKGSSYNGDGLNGTDPSTSKKKRRPVDFPPWAYNVIGGDNPKREPVVVRLQEDGQTTQQVVYEYKTKVPDCKPSEKPWWVLLQNNDQSKKRSRLRTERSYARKEPFELENIGVPPSLCDLSTPPCPPSDSFWISAQARVLSFSAAYLAFPFITRFVSSFVTMPADQLDEITSKFGPGIAILYSTFISLTLSILYNRQRTIQDHVSNECSDLVVLTRNLLSLFQYNQNRAIQAGQCVADQIRTLVRSSRGSELTMLMYSDPYARLRELIDEHEQEVYADGGSSYMGASLVANSRDTIRDLFQVRASRLSDESLALPPTHFFILNFLTLFMLLSFTVNTIPTVDQLGSPSNESRLLFGMLTTIYVLFFNFASDLNGPFQGVYQIRRSCAASHLLQLKWLIANHPLLRGGEVDFDDPDDDESTHARVQSPGLGEFWFEQQEQTFS